MIDLQCAIISLRFANLTITAEYLEGNSIYFHRFGRPHIYDLSSGTIYADNWEVSGCGMRQVIISSLERRCNGATDMYQKMSDHEKALLYHEIMTGKMNESFIHNEVLAFITTLASRQVKGDELIKGLKAMNLRTPERFKVTRLYTGGWKLEGMSKGTVRTFNVEAFANYFEKQFE
jgi:hypothetical protein